MIRNLYFYLTLSFVFSFAFSCNSNVNVEVLSSKELDENFKEGQSIFTSKLVCQNEVPLEFPVVCRTILLLNDKVQKVDNFNTDFKIVNSNCPGVRVNHNGEVDGILNLNISDSCQFQLEVSIGKKKVISNSQKILVEDTVSLSFENNIVELRKGGPTKKVQINLSRVIDKELEVDYQIYGIDSLPDGFSLKQNGKIVVPSNSLTFELDLELPNGSDHEGTSEYTLKLGSGVKGEESELLIRLYEGEQYSFSKIATGADFSCGISSLGELFCWGSDLYGRLGNGTEVGDRVILQQVGIETDWTDISLNFSHVCGIRAGELYCWGNGGNGKLGNGSNSNRDLPTRVGNLDNWTNVNAGDSHTCGVESGNLYCWGSDSNGQLGNGNIDTGDRLVPVSIGVLGGWSKVSAGYRHTCGINNLELYCWGESASGRLGNGDSSAIVEDPLLIAGLNNWSEIVSDFEHSCGIESGRLYCWGSNSFGRLGHGGSVDVPAQVGVSTNWLSISTGYRHSCGVDGGILKCWGADIEGALGNGNTQIGQKNFPVEISDEVGWSSVAVGSDHSCGVKNNYIYCWGDGRRGQTAVNSAQSSKLTVPLIVSIGEEWEDLAIGENHSCGIKNGMLYCWGRNTSGQVANLMEDLIPYPERILLDHNWKHIRVGSHFSCGIKNGELYCWGSDTYGQIGNGNIVSGNVLSPMRIGNLVNWTFISLGVDHACGIESGKLYCWGRGVNEKIGDGPGTGNITSPLELMGINWSSVSTGANHTCGIREGELYCWGSDSYGQIGNGSMSSALVPSPEKIGLSDAWTGIAVGENHTCGINNGDLYCWGRDTNGVQGNGDIITSIIQEPELIDNSRDWKSLSSGLNHICATSFDDRIFCWGEDEYGQQGSGPPINHKSEPIELSNVSEEGEIISGGNSTCFIGKLNLKCWGDNSKGQLGVGVFNSMVLPVFF